MTKKSSCFSHPDNKTQVSNNIWNREIAEVGLNDYVEMYFSMKSSPGANKDSISDSDNQIFSNSLDDCLS